MAVTNEESEEPSSDGAAAPKILQELNQLIPVAYEELRRVAGQRMAHLRPGGTLSPTDLVNEVLLRLLKRDQREYCGAEHLIRVAAQAMHNLLVDRARRQFALKRGGPSSNRVELDDQLPIAAPVHDMLSFDEACEAVRANPEQHHLILLLRIYAGLSIDEIATELGCSSRTIERQWKFIKATLHVHLFPTERSPIP